MRKHKGLLSTRAEELAVLLGSNIELARTRRRLTISAICKRAGITAQTYKRLADGETGVTLAVILNVLGALDLDETLAGVAAPETDQVGLSLERLAQPKRIRERAQDGLDTDF